MATVRLFPSQVILQQKAHRSKHFVSAASVSRVLDHRCVPSHPALSGLEISLVQSIVFGMAAGAPCLSLARFLQIFLKGRDEGTGNEKDGDA